MCLFFKNTFIFKNTQPVEEPKFHRNKVKSFYTINPITPSLS